MFRPFQRRRPSNRSRSERAARQPRRLHVQQLEPRTMFAGDGLLLSNDAYLTLSFAADGVQVAGQANALAAKFNTIAPEAVWQAAILKAFQIWAMRTNADIGVVGDGGQPFGTPGATHGDSRFGDIRIAAIAMDPQVGGESVPIDKVVGGTWHGDVVFNTQFPYQSVDEIFRIALHEAGHVFGLEESNDPNSPLHSGTIPTATVPTATDTLNLQTLFGTRRADINERNANGGPAAIPNDSFETATLLDLNKANGGHEGTAPSLVYGDITTFADVDFFHITVPGDYTGSATFRLRTAGISLLAPHLQIFNAAQQLIQDQVSSSVVGDELIVSFPNVPEDATYFVRIASAAADEFGIGGYSLSVTFDGINQIDPVTLNQYSGGSLRKLSQDEIQRLLDPEAEDFLNDDLHVDDDLNGAINLQSETDFGPQRRYEVVGSITDSIDRDFYQIKSPTALDSLSALTVTVRSLVAGQLVPKINAYDRDLNPLPVTILSNGGGEIVVQIVGIEANKNYYLEVAASDPTGPFNTGNYQLTASFRDRPENLQVFAAGTLAVGIGQNVHTLYVAKPQLLHLLLQAGAAVVAGPTAVAVAIYNEADQLVYRLASPTGESRSQGAVLLAPGTYTIRISALTLIDSVTVPLSYELRGAAISDPFVTDPNDPTTHPFLNPDPSTGGAYLYPGNIISNDPLLWSDFINSLPNAPPQVDLQQLISLLLGNWWSWFWAQTGANGQPLALSDGYQTPANTTLNVTRELGLLTNDIEPEGSAMTAVLSSSPTTGQLSFNADGSFQFTPAPGFNGTVLFTYQASDFTQLSNTQTVSIAVGLIGDYDDNGLVNQLDRNAWQAAFGSTTLLEADGNGNGIVDAADFVLWRKNLPAPPAGTAGDYDKNGVVNQVDYDAWQANFGSTAALNADGNGNGAVDAADYVLWRKNLPPAPAMGSGSSVSTAAASETILEPAASNVAAAPAAATLAFVFDTQAFTQRPPASAVTLPVEPSLAASSVRQLQLAISATTDTPSTRPPFSTSHSVTDEAFDQLDAAFDPWRLAAKSHVRKKNLSPLPRAIRAHRLGPR